eukprot:scaffold28837_cov116-Isochrysis_galbana.AAC.5
MIPPIVSLLVVFAGPMGSSSCDISYLTVETEHGRLALAVAVVRNDMKMKDTKNERHKESPLGSLPPLMRMHEAELLGRERLGAAPGSAPPGHGTGPAAFALPPDARKSIGAGRCPTRPSAPPLPPPFAAPAVPRPSPWPTCSASQPWPSSHRAAQHNPSPLPVGLPSPPCARTEAQVLQFRDGLSVRPHRSASTTLRPLCLAPPHALDQPRHLAPCWACESPRKHRQLLARGQGCAQSRPPVHSLREHRDVLPRLALCKRDGGLERRLWRFAFREQSDRGFACKPNRRRRDVGDLARGRVGRECHRAPATVPCRATPGPFGCAARRPYAAERPGGARAECALPSAAFVQTPPPPGPGRTASPATPTLRLASASAFFFSCRALLSPSSLRRAISTRSRSCSSSKSCCTKSSPQWCGSLLLAAPGILAPSPLPPTAARPLSLASDHAEPASYGRAGRACRGKRKGDEQGGVIDLSSTPNPAEDSCDRRAASGCEAS